MRDQEKQLEGVKNLLLTARLEIMIIMATNDELIQQAKIFRVVTLYAFHFT